MFDEMSRDREIIYTQLTSLESSDTQGRGGSCDVMSREEFDKLFREIEREWRYKLMEVRHGKAAADRSVDEVTVSYLLDTCPGSSGSGVVSYVVENRKNILKHQVPHSKSGPQGGGFSGAGCMFVDSK